MIKTIFDDIVILKCNQDYRLGDLIFGTPNAWLPGSKIRNARENILNHPVYEGSILRGYLESHALNDHEYLRLRKVNMNALISVVDSHMCKVKPCENTLYINIRMGDVVMSENNIIDADNSYMRLRSTFLYRQHALIKGIRDRIKSCPEINRIELVTALHFEDDEIHNTWRYSQEAVDANREKFNHIIKMLDRNNITLPISIISKVACNVQHVDWQLLHLCSAKHVILDGGGFSNLIKKIREHL